MVLTHIARLPVILWDAFERWRVAAPQKRFEDCAYRLAQATHAMGYSEEQMIKAAGSMWRLLSNEMPCCNEDETSEW